MMTLLQMANSIVSLVGQVDSVALGICKERIRFRYQDVWDKYLWRDTQMLGTVDLNPNTRVFDLPPDMDRLVTIGNEDGTFLDPVDEGFLIEAASDVLTSSGVPQYYTEISGRVNVYPLSDKTITFRLFGKRRCPGLPDDSSTSLLRNCDNVITAFAQFDMLERLRQSGKAQLKLQEAEGLFAQAKSVEVDQANRPRRAKFLTVAGNSLAEMTDAVCAICGQWAPDIRILVKEFLRRNYVSLYQLQLWPESTVVVRVAAIGEQIILPYFVDRVLSARTGDGFQIMPNEVSYLFAVSPNVFEATGTSVSMSTLTPVAVSIFSAVPPEALSIASDDVADAGKRVFIRGESDGTEVTEELILAVPGSPAVTQFPYDVPLTIAKPITRGDVTVNGAVTGALYQFIPAGERERKHQRLWLLPPPPAHTGPVECAQGILILGKRKIIPLRTDEDTPIITGAQGVLIAGAAADLFTRLGNGDMAAKYSARADAAAKVLISENTDQSAYCPKIVPLIEPYALGVLDEGYCLSK